MIRRSSSFFFFPYRTLTRAGLSALPLDLCEQLPRLRVLWVDTHQGEKLEVQKLIHTTQLRRPTPNPPPPRSMNLHNHISVKSNQYRKLLSCRVAILTELTIISHTINPQLVTVYCVCVLLQGAFLQPDRGSAQLLPLLCTARDVSFSTS